MATGARGMKRRFTIVLKPGFGRKRCPVCGARPFQSCREPTYGWRDGRIHTRHYERYELEKPNPERSLEG